MKLPVSLAAALLLVQPWVGCMATNSSMAGTGHESVYDSINSYAAYHPSTVVLKNWRAIEVQHLVIDSDSARGETIELVPNPLVMLNFLTRVSYFHSSIPVSHPFSVPTQTIHEVSQDKGHALEGALVGLAIAVPSALHWLALRPPAPAPNERGWFYVPDPVIALLGGLIVVSLCTAIGSLITNHVEYVLDGAS